MHAFLIYDVTQMLDRAYAKGSLIQVGTQFVLSQGLKDLLNVLQVLILTLVEDKDVIQIKNHKQVVEGPQDVIH